MGAGYPGSNPQIPTAVIAFVCIVIVVILASLYNRSISSCCLVDVLLWHFPPFLFFIVVRLLTQQCESNLSANFCVAKLSAKRNDGDEELQQVDCSRASHWWWFRLWWPFWDGFGMEAVKEVGSIVVPSRCQWPGVGPQDSPTIDRPLSS